MDIVARLQKLDNLIIDSTKPPVTAMLRQELSLITEQVEAYQASSDKQDATLAVQIRKIEQLMTENAQLKAAQAPPPLERRRNLLWFPNETTPVCPHCWDMSGNTKTLRLFGPERPFTNPLGEVWECNVCNTRFSAQDPTLDFTAHAPRGRRAK